MFKRLAGADTMAVWHDCLSIRQKSLFGNGKRKTIEQAKKLNSSFLLCGGG
jgi:hypothetical protein